MGGRAKVQKVPKLAKHSVKQRKITDIGGGGPIDRFIFTFAFEFHTHYTKYFFYFIF